MEKKIDSQLVRFIHDNLQETVRESERFLNGKLDEEELRKVADEVWATNAQAPVAKIRGPCAGRRIDEFVDIAVDSGCTLRTTPFFADLVEQVVHNLVSPARQEANCSLAQAEIGHHAGGRRGSDLSGGRSVGGEGAARRVSGWRIWSRRACSYL
jgi:hypothetical protein